MGTPIGAHPLSSPMAHFAQGPHQRQAYGNGQMQSSMIGGTSREAYMQQRIHRRLHAKAATLIDEELYELGQLSFNQQFPMCEQFDEIAGQHGDSDIFGGVTREQYMATRVHRRLHPQAARLTNEELLEIGKINFNEQFERIE